MAGLKTINATLSAQKYFEMNDGIQSSTFWYVQRFCSLHNIFPPTTLLAYIRIDMHIYHYMDLYYANFGRVLRQAGRACVLLVRSEHS